MKILKSTASQSNGLGRLRAHVTQTIQGQISLWVGLSVFVGVVILIAVAAVSLRAAAIRDAQKQVVVAAENEANRVTAELNQALFTARALAQSLSVVKTSEGTITLTRDQANAILRQVLVDNPQFLGTYTVWEPDQFDGRDADFVNQPGHDATGRLIPYWVRGANNAIRLDPLLDYETPGIGDYYLLPKQTKQEQVLPPFLYPIEDQQVLLASFVVPIVYRNAVYGMAGVDLRADFLQELVDRLNLYNGSATMSLIGSDEAFVTVTNQPALADQPLTAELLDGVRRIQSGEVSNVIATTTDGRNLEVYVPVRLGTTKVPWVVTLSVPWSAVTAEADAALWRLIGVGLLLLMAALAGVVLVAQRIARPVTQLTNVARQVSAGDLNAQAEVNAQNEIGELGQVLNQMTGQLRGTIISLEERVRERTADLEEAQALAKVGRFEIDAATQQVTWSDSLYKVFGIPASRTAYDLEHNIWDFVLPDDKAQVQADFGHALTTGQPLASEFRVRTPSGAQLTVSTRGQAVLNEEGQPVKLVGILQDVTEQKRQEAAVRDSEERYQLAVEGSNEGVWDWDITTNVAYFSSRWKAQIGYAEHEFENSFAAFEKALHPDDHDHVLTTVGDYLSGKRANYDVEFRFRHKAGTYRWILARGKALRDSDGKPYRMAGSHTDVTERKLAEQDLAKRALELETVTQLSTTAARLADPQALLQTMVDSVKQAFGLYHAHIYLMDEIGQKLVLTAGAGAVGEQMVARRFSIPLDRERSLVARAARTRQGAIVNDVTQEPDFLPNPLLPQTRAELSVPLIVGDEVLGVLDVQHDQPGHFTEADADIQTILASQIAIALSNARARQQSEQALSELELATRQRVRSEWDTYSKQNAHVQAEFENPKVAEEANLQVVEEIISLHGEPIGRIVAEGADEDTQTVLNAISESLGLHLDNLRLTEQTQQALLENERQNATLATINRVVSAASGARDLPTLLDGAAHEILQALHARNVGIAVFTDASHTQLKVMADANINPADVSAVGVSIPVVGNTSTEYVLTNRHSLVVENAQTDPRTASIHSLMRGRGTHSLIIVPLLARGEIIGTIGVDSDDPHRHFSNEEVSLVETMAGQLAGAIDNLRSFEQTQWRANREAIINDITAKIQGTVTVDSALQTTIQELGKALKARKTRVALGVTSTELEPNGHTTPN
jgi:PAS domain S-box-containing protein